MTGIYKILAVFLLFCSFALNAQDTLVTTTLCLGDTLVVEKEAILDTVLLDSTLIDSTLTDSLSWSGRIPPGPLPIAINVAPLSVVIFIDTSARVVEQASLPPLKDTICIIGTGDIMLGTNYPSTEYLPPGEDCSPLLRPVHHILQSGDVLFGNLEGGFGNGGGTPKGCKDTTKCYVFRMPEHFAACLVEAGFDVMSVANNHVNDFGLDGRENTALILDSMGIAYAGFATHPWTIFEKGGLTYGFAAFAPNKGTMDMKDYRGAARITRMLDSIADVVIISFHGGGEGKDHQHVVRGDEEYLGYNRGSVYRFAHDVIDAGADVVFGHGPHVTRALELYKDRLICYSLGNFATYRRFNLSGPNGIAPIVKVNVTPEGKFLSGEVIPVYQPGEGGPRPDPRKRAIHKLIELTTADFPGQNLVIGVDGSLTGK